MIRMVTWLKYGLIVAVIIFIVMLHTGDASSSTPFSDVRKAVTGSVDLGGMYESNNQMIRRFYGLSPEDYEDMVLYASESSMGVQEILIVRMADVSQQETVRAAMESRKAAQIEVFEGYGPEQVALLNRCVIEVQGNYALFIVHDHAVAAQKAFSESL